MLRLYRTTESKLADEIEEALGAMSLARKVVRVRSEADLPDGLARGDLPALSDSGEVVTGEAGLRTHLEDLRELVDGWRRFQSDTCEPDAEGNVC